MSNLKELRVSIASVQSTKRITSAMKMVAIAKLRRASDTVEASRPYSSSMSDMLSRLSKGTQVSNLLLSGTGSSDKYLFVVISSDRGLCGGFNINLLNKVRRRVLELKSFGKQVKILTVGSKANSFLSALFADDIIDRNDNLNKPSPSYDNAEKIGDKVLDLLKEGLFDVCDLYYSKSLNALEQVAQNKQLVPLTILEEAEEEVKSEAVYTYDNSEEEILKSLLPKNLKVQIYVSMLESFASEQSARMVAMDNATKNASDRITELSTSYNRMRQASITKELIEIISGAEAL